MASGLSWKCSVPKLEEKKGEKLNKTNLPTTRKLFHFSVRNVAQAIMMIEINKTEKLSSCPMNEINLISEFNKNTSHTLNQESRGSKYL